MRTCGNICTCIALTSGSSLIVDHCAVTDTQLSCFVSCTITTTIGNTRHYLCFVATKIYKHIQTHRH